MTLFQQSTYQGSVLQKKILLEVSFISQFHSFVILYTCNSIIKSVHLNNATHLCWLQARGWWIRPRRPFLKQSYFDLVLKTEDIFLVNRPAMLWWLRCLINPQLKASPITVLDHWKFDYVCHFLALVFAPGGTDQLFPSESADRK